MIGGDFQAANRHASTIFLSTEKRDYRAIFATGLDSCIKLNSVNFVDKLSMQM